MPNHNTTGAATIWQMVRDRVPTLADDNTNELLVSRFTLQYMFALEPCFQVATRQGAITEDSTRIGNEDVDGEGIAIYGELEKSIVADLVACMVLLNIIAGNSAITTTSGTTSGTYLKKAKAGEAEVEYGQVNANQSLAFNMKPDALLDRYKKAAIAKAYTKGCEIEVCDDCTIKLKASKSTPMPFMVVTGANNCGCNG